MIPNQRRNDPHSPNSIQKPQKPHRLDPRIPLPQRSTQESPSHRMIPFSIRLGQETGHSLVPAVGLFSQ